MFGQELFVDSRLVIKALKIAMRNKLYQVLVPYIALAKQDQVMVGFFPLRGGTVCMTASRDVDFATDDRLDPLLQGCFIKADRSKKVSMIRDSGGRHFQFSHPVDDRAYFTGAIEKAVIGVKMEMNELRLIHGSSQRGERFKRKVESEREGSLDTSLLL
jgi:hypothetical protein